MIKLKDLKVGDKVLIKKYEDIRDTKYVPKDNPIWGSEAFISKICDTGSIKFNNRSYYHDLDHIEKLLSTEQENLGSKQFLTDNYSSIENIERSKPNFKETSFRDGRIKKADIYYTQDGCKFGTLEGAQAHIDKLDYTARAYNFVENIVDTKGYFESVEEFIANNKLKLIEFFNNEENMKKDTSTNE